MSLQQLHNQIDECKECFLHKLKTNQTQGVYGKLLTNHKIKNLNKTKLLLIGMAPSYRRFDTQRRAFEGVSPSNNLKDINTSGDFFYYCLNKSKLKECDIFITNIIKCSTEKNEEPSKESVDKCRKLLDLEISTINPDFIITMGNFVRMNLNAIKSKKNIHMKHPSYYFRFKSENSVNLAVQELNNIYENTKLNNSKLGEFLK